MLFYSQHFNQFEPKKLPPNSKFQNTNTPLFLEFLNLLLIWVCFSFRKLRSVCYVLDSKSPFSSLRQIVEHLVMSSLGSLPFAMDAKTGSSLLLPAINSRGPRFFFPKNSLEFTASSDSTLGFLKLYGSSERGAVVLRPRVTKKGSMEDGDEEGIETWLSAMGWVEDGDSETDQEAVSPETIEKRNEILARHRELLSSAMIFEAKRSNVTEQENVEVSCEGSDSTFPTQSSGSTSEDALSSNCVHSSADEVPEFRHSPVSGSFIESEKKPATAVPSKRTPLGVRSAKRVTNGCAFTPKIPKMEGKKDFIESGLKEPLAVDNVMNIILVAAECAPWSKTGGLGDVAGALPKALARRGHRVMVVAPRYGHYIEARYLGVRKRYKVYGQDVEVVYYHAFIDGVDFVFMDSPKFNHLENIYGGNRMDILQRMVLFCKAAVEVPWYVPCGGVCYGDGNLVFIANDWHTALLPVYLKAYYRDNKLMTFARSVLVIHNIAHQGRGPLEDFRFVDLPPHYLDLFKMYDPVGGEHFNFIKAGLITADRVVTVSCGYAWELKTSEGGWGLHGIISENGWKLTGIVNGIDTKEWSPEVDNHLTSDGYTNYSLETLQTGKPQCKAALQKELGLPIRKDVPLIAFIGRLDGQKGVDIIAEAIPWMMKQDVQLVMLGTGRPDLEKLVKRLENEHKGMIKGCVGFCVKTSHRITAGADILLMPSRFEPCGLNQLYAMRYGTVPVVHAVGGLRDTVVPFDPFNESGLGWTFDSADSKKLIRALYYCLLTYRKYKKSWEGLQRRGMMQDLSWDNVAPRYEEVLVAAKYHW